MVAALLWDRTMEPGESDDPSDSEGPGGTVTHEGLTRREVAVIRDLLAGRSNKEIGRALGIREQTVKNVMSRVLKKLELQDRLQVALYARDTRLLRRYAVLLGE